MYTGTARCSDVNTYVSNVHKLSGRQHIELISKQVSK